MANIACVIDKPPATVFSYLQYHGGIRPRRRFRRAEALSLEEREQISRGISHGLSVRSIARTLHRSPSTISREVNKNGGRKRYRAIIADKSAWRRGKRPKAFLLSQNSALKDLVDTKFREDWSPEQIAGWLKLTYPGAKGMHVSHETIYKSLFVQTRGLFRKELRNHLRSKRKFRHAKGHKPGSGQQIVEGVSIRERPAAVEDRAVPGHWEGDLICGAKNSYIATIVERQAHAVLSQMHNKTDDNDAAMLAELARTGFYKKVEVKSRVAQERRVLLKAREIALKARVNVENTIRGLLASFGLRLPKHLSTYEQRVHALVQDRPVLSGIILPLMELRTAALRQAAALTKEMARCAKEDEACQRLMTIPGVGPVSAVTFVATIDDPRRFAKSRSVGAYLGLTSRRYQSGDMDFGGRISKRGDAMLRSTFYEAASSLLNRVKPGKGAGLQARASHKKAVVALARKLAVLMHAIWTNGSTFQPKEA